MSCFLSLLLSQKHKRITKYEIFCIDLPFSNTEDNPGKILLQKHELDYSPPASCCLQNSLKQNSLAANHQPEILSLVHLQYMNIRVEQFFDAQLLYHGGSSFSSTAAKTMKLQPWSAEAAAAARARCRRWKHLKLGGLQNI